MADSEVGNSAPPGAGDSVASSPLVFISHDTRDAELAEAFSKLLKSVSSGMLKSFRSSDKKGTEGIDFGEEWYNRLMDKLQSTSDVVCLFTDRSLDRPWILYEAGVAKGRMEVPVIGIALGVPLKRISSGPFYQFQNLDDSETDLTKLVQQLARRIPSLELDDDVVKSQVVAFKSTADAILNTLASTAGKTEADVTEENSIAKLAEEMKALPSRVADRLAECGDPYRRRRSRRLDPMMIDEVLHVSEEPGDPVGILVAASLVRDDAPWLYELAMEVYRAVKGGDQEAIQREMMRLRHFSKIVMRGPLMEEMGMGGKEGHMLHMEFPHMLERILQRSLESLGEEKASTSPTPRFRPKRQQPTL